MKINKKGKITKITKKVDRALKGYVVIWSVRILGFLSLLSVPLSFTKFDLWQHLNIEAPMLLIGMALFFLWFSIEIFNRIPTLIEEPLSELSNHLDHLGIISTFSKKIDEEIKDKIAKYKKVDIFAYTAETLDMYLPGQFNYEGERKNIRVLTRNWNEERKCENEWNKEKELPDDDKRVWKKSYKMESSNPSNKFDEIERIKIEQRFYDEAPLFRCYIFGDEEYKEAYFGFYEWQENPERGSPYKGVIKGVDQPLFHITNETVLGERTLKVIVSRFNHCWKYGKTRNEIETSGIRVEQKNQIIIASRF